MVGFPVTKSRNGRYCDTKRKGLTCVRCPTLVVILRVRRDETHPSENSRDDAGFSQGERGQNRIRPRYMYRRCYFDNQM